MWKSLLAISILTMAVPGVVAQQRFAERTDVVLVEIPVQVERNGEPVRGLTIGDFEVRDGRKKAQIVALDVVDLTAPVDDTDVIVGLSAAARRHFLFLFDLSLSDPARIVQAQQAAIQLAESGLHPSDLAAVATYSSRTGVALRLGFTADRRQLEVAIRTLGLQQLVHRVADPLSLTLTDLASSTRGPDEAALAASRGIDTEAEIAEVVREIEGEITAAGRRNQLLAFASGLTELGRMLGAVEGRKHVVLLSEGFDASALLGTGVRSSEERERIERVSEAAAEGRIWEVGDDERFGSTEDQGFLRKMAEEFIRADCTIQSVDIGGLRAGGAATGAATDSGAVGMGQDGLFLMADQTGGGFYRNFNRLDEAMNRMLARTSVTYVLAIQPDKIKRDGAFHRLKVKLTKNVKGARLTHRPGYFAPKPAAEVTVLEKKLSIAGLVLGGQEGGSVGGAVLAAAYDVGADRAHVPVLVEVDGATLLDGVAAGTVPTQIYVYGIDREGSVVDFFTRALGLNLAELGPTLRRTGLKYWGHLELPPGDYTLRVVVRNDTSGSTGVRQATVKVPDVRGGEAALWPPLVPEPQGKWVFGRERPEEQGDFPYPFMADGRPFVPAAHPAVARGQSLQLILAGYHLGASPTVSAELYGRDGARVDGCEIALEDGSARSGGGRGPDQWVARFSPGRAVPGDYRLVVTMTDDVGTAHRSEIRLAVEG